MQSKGRQWPLPVTYRAPLPKPPPPHPPPPPTKEINTPDWFVLPSSVQHLPPRPPIPGLASPVTEDVGMAKMPAQIQSNAFYPSIEPYIRYIKEEALASWST